jgi:hypothetical protein
MTKYDQQVAELMTAKTDYIVMVEPDKAQPVIDLDDVAVPKPTKAKTNAKAKPEQQVANANPAAGDTTGLVSEEPKSVKPAVNRVTTGLGLSLDDILLEETQVAEKTAADKKLFNKQDGK